MSSITSAIWQRYRRVACRSIGLMAAIGVVVALVPGLAPLRTPWRPSPAIAGNWILKFHDEFDGTSLNRSKWSTRYPWGARTNPGNHELEYYVDDAFQVSNGVLRIRAERRRTHGFDYTSGMITTYNSYTTTYGYFEIRAKVPRGSGFWPTFWLAPKDMSWPPEIDIFEMRGDHTNVDHMTNHYTTSLGPKQSHFDWSGADFSQGFHTFGLEWSPARLVWYVDGVQRYEITSHIPTKKMYMILSFAVGGDWVEPPDMTTRFPSYLEVTYIRAYQRS